MPENTTDRSVRPISGSMTCRTAASSSTKTISGLNSAISASAFCALGLHRFRRGVGPVGVHAVGLHRQVAADRPAGGGERP